jgi:hypothetical protein
MELWVNETKITPLTPTPAHDNIHGADITLADATTSTGYPTSWFSGTPAAWTFTYLPNYNVNLKTNLPILAVFNNTDFPNAMQPPQIKKCNGAFEIWNWADLAYLRVLAENKQLDTYEKYILMQDLGIPNVAGSYGDGTGCPYTDGQRMFGYYGYQNYVDVGSFNPNVTTSTTTLYYGNPATALGAFAWYTDHTGWMPIGTWNAAPYLAKSFIGEFDGQGFAVNGLWINRSSSSDIGLFGYTYGASIENLGVNISDAGVKGYYYVGGLVGLNFESSIENCYATGNVTGIGCVGGLMGRNGNATIINCYATGNIEGTEWVGGLVGYHNESSIENCYTIGNVTGTGLYVGGLAG